MKRGHPAQAEAHGIATVLGLLAEALAMIDTSASLPPNVGARLQEVIDSIREHDGSPLSQQDLQGDSRS